MVTDVPGMAMGGKKPEIVGAPVGLPATVKSVALVAVDEATVTEIFPVVAPSGTVASISVGVTGVTEEAGTPVNLTVF
jgi:hypothetical protein